MTNQDREIILKVVNGEQEILPIAHKIYGYVNHSYIFAYLIRRGLTGKHLKDFLFDSFGGSIALMVKHIVNEINLYKKSKLKGLC